MITAMEKTFKLKSSQKSSKILILNIFCSLFSDETVALGGWRSRGCGALGVVDEQHAQGGRPGDAHDRLVAHTVHGRRPGHVGAARTRPGRIRPVAGAQPERHVAPQRGPAQHR